jgi:glycosyltransferase involved in cell wall biosynthesis
VREKLLECGVRPAAVTTVVNGIDASAFRRDSASRSMVRASLGIDAHEFVVGTVGRLTSAKRYDLLIAAIAELRRTHPYVRLFIAGDGPLRDALQSQVRQLGLEQCCELLGQRADVGGVHHAFDLFVQSSATEGTPNAVLEAMALETPIVATDVGGTRQLIRHDVDGFLVSWGSVGALAAAIVMVMNNPDRAHGWTTNARRRVEQDLSFETRMGKVETIYTELMTPRANRSGSSHLPMTA